MALVCASLLAGTASDVRAHQLKRRAPVLRKVEEMECERTEIEQRIVGWDKDDEAAHALANVTDAQVRTMLGHMADEMRLYERTALKDFLTSILDRIELDPDQQTLQLCNRIPLRGGVSVASPRGFELTPPAAWESTGELRGRRAA